MILMAKRLREKKKKSRYLSYIIRKYKFIVTIVHIFKDIIRENKSLE